MLAHVQPQFVRYANQNEGTSWLDTDSAVIDKNQTRRKTVYDAEKLDVGGRLNLKVYRKWWVYLPFATMHAEWLQNVLLTSRIAPAARSPLLVVRVHSCRENIGEAHSSRIFSQEKASFRDTEAETRETIGRHETTKKE